MAELKVYNFISTTGKGGTYHPHKAYSKEEMEMIRSSCPDMDISDTVVTEQALEKLRKSAMKGVQEAFC